MQRWSDVKILRLWSEVAVEEQCLVVAAHPHHLAAMAALGCRSCLAAMERRKILQLWSNVLWRHIHIILQQYHTTFILSSSKWIHPRNKTVTLHCRKISLQSRRSNLWIRSNFDKQVPPSSQDDVEAPPQRRCSSIARSRPY